MKTRILLTDESEDSKKAITFCLLKQIPFDELPAHPVWKEVGWKIPSFFTKERIFKGLKEIQKIPQEFGIGKPN